MSHTLLYAVVLLCLASAARHAAGQGLLPSFVPRVGATNTLTQLQQQYRNSQAWKRAYKQRPRSACGTNGGASLCAAQSTDAADVSAQLMLATSPHAYSSTSSSRPRLVSPAQDQALCQACTAFAVAAAAETALAAALQVDVQQCSISVQALFFCAPDRPTRSCDAGWNLPDALQQLQQRGQSLPTASCLPYKPDYMGDLPAEVLCSGTCNNPSPHAAHGKFSSQQITSVWKAQRHIRQHGAVVSRFDVYTDFDSFFADRRNAQAVYRPSAGAKFQYHHAITLVGYNNEQEYWVAKNSWGSSWADNGLFKVAYGVGTIMAADKGEAFGIVWTPSSTPSALQLPVTPGPRRDCYWYKARSGDYLSKVAWLAGIPLDKFMLDNTDQVTDLDASLQGLQLLLCNPKQGAVKVPASNPTSTPGSGFTAAPGDAQLEALLRVKAALDSTGGVLREWTRANGARGGYCEWWGVVCTEGTISVYFVNIWAGGGIQGLKGTLPPAAAFSGLGALTRITIADQPGISGTLPMDWSRMTQLQDIRLINNSLTGSIPSSWSALSKLKMLSLRVNKLTGRIPDSLGALTSLEDVGLSYNTLSGTIPDLSRLSRMKELYLHTNKLSGRIPDSLGALTSLEDVSLSNNALSGTIPDLSRLTRLKVLDLDDNKLSGRIPDSLGALTSLEEVSLSRNALSGTLPAWLGGLSQLQVLVVESTKLSGSIPPSLGRLTRLSTLWLGGNQLVGALPDSFKALTALQQLGLDRTQLVGSVPRSWSSMTKLKKVWLYNSAQLAGCLPASWKQQLAGWDVETEVHTGTNVRGFC